MNNKTISRCIKFAESKFPNHPYIIKENNVYKKSKFLHFAFIVRGNTIVSWGWNHHGTAPKGYGYGGYTVHAEVHAFERARNLLNGDSFEMLNIRFNKNCQMNNSMPCKCCIEFLRVMGCKVAYFSTDCGITTLKL